MTNGIAYVRDFLPSLTSVGRGQWKSLCPCHKDKDPSLSITLKNKVRNETETDRWRLYFRCPVCGANGSDVCDAAGMERKRAFEPSKDDIADMERPTNSLPLPCPAEIEEYHRRFRDKVRRDFEHWRGFTPPEEFKVGWNGGSYTVPIFSGDELINCLRWNRDGVKLWPGTHHCLYPHVPPGRGWLLIVEGIGDCLMGRAYGLPTITGTGGALHWPDNYARELRGRGLVVVYDCDEAGRKGAQKVSNATGARIVDLASRRHDGWDLSDHLRKYRSIERLMEMVHGS